MSTESNVHRHSSLWVLWAAFAVLHAVGCGDNAAAIRAVQDAVQTSSNRSQDVEEDDLVTMSMNEQNFMPQNPGRANPFELNTGPEKSTQTTTFAGISSAKQVVVMGFAEVGTSRVMLRIGDQTKILKEGDQVSGVEVVSITPPQVELRMDNLMWTATMFDERSK